MKLLGRRVIIVGQGVSGQGAKHALDMAGAVSSFYPEGKASAEFMVVSPGIPPDHECFSLKIPVIGEFALGALINDKPVAAVTGTNGKTTVCEMLADMLSAKYKVALCGNIGASFARVAADGGYRVAVTEVSSFQLEHITGFHPAAAAILNIAPDHLDRYPDFGAYARTKLKIAADMRGGLLVLNADDIPSGLLEGFFPDANVRYVSLLGRVDGAYMADGALYLNGVRLCDRSALKADGDHNVANALCAALMADYFGITAGDILKVFGAFEPGDHRIKEVGRKNGVTFYNDSKGTNPSSTLAAVRALSGGGRICLILGGSDKGLDYGELFAKLPDDAVAVITGATSAKMRKAAREAGRGYILAANMRIAVEKAFASGCQTVLLSPAAASFDSYDNYAERGEDFIRAVKAL